MWFCFHTDSPFEMFELISKFFRRSPSPELPTCEQDLILKKLSYDELRLIFDFLNLKELVKCRRVCKTFRSLVGSIRLRELFVFKRDVYERVNWSQADRPLHSRNWMVVKYFSSVLSRQILGQNLKFLSLKCGLESFRLEGLNWFVELEELRLLELEIRNSHSKVTLRLPNLKKITFFLTFYPSPSFGFHPKFPSVVLDTPSLEDVRVERSLHMVQFKFGATVKCLQIDTCERTFEFLEQFLELKNLECFSCTDPTFLDEFDVLKFKPNLKRIDCHRHESGKQFDVKRLIERLLEQKAEWSLSVEIYFEGQLVKDMSDLDKLILQNNA